MREVEVFLWRVPPAGRRRGCLSTVHRTPDEAFQECGPDAAPEPGSRRLRPALETEEEQRRGMYNYQSAGHDSVKPPPRRQV